MRIVNFQVHNYKSFLSSQEVQFSPGFNVLVGQNNAGKTAFLEALSTNFSDIPHRSLKTVPNPRIPLTAKSRIDITIELGQGELEELLKISATDFYLPLNSQSSFNDQAEQFLASLGGSISIAYSYGSDGLTSHAANMEDESTGRGMRFQVDQRSNQITTTYSISEGLSVNAFFPVKLWEQIRKRIYLFTAERLNLSEAQFGITADLFPNARNLATVLNLLQSRNPDRFQEFNQYVNTVFPEIKQITTPPASDSQAQIMVWTVDPSTQRADLAIHLSATGTGVGQVLAMLYVVVTSDYPRTIIIDEPQRFLHPGAIRKLFDIFKFYPQHQFIVSSHSPTVVTTANPQTLLLVRKEAGESIIEAIDVTETSNLRLLLSEVGARLSDVFGADDILWVEGATEEQCFPLILSAIARCPLLGTVILGVVQVGDFTSKQSKTILEIYTRLSTGRGLLPPAIGFIFDPEDRNETERQDLERQSEGKISFLPRKMYENYLLNPNAVAEVMSGLADFRATPVSAEEIQKWIEEHCWDAKFFDKKVIPEEQRNDKTWLEKVHGADLLHALFTEFSEARYHYLGNKVEYGVALTKWLIENSPEDLKEVSDSLVQILEKSGQSNLAL